MQQLKFFPIFFCRLHPAAGAALEEMYHSALKDNIKIGILSAYRSIEQQIEIWNSRYEGKKPLFDEYMNILDISKLSDAEKINYILNWVSVPGCSRHQWGTDIDLYDATMHDSTNLILTPADYFDNNRFGPLHKWLTNHAHKYGFYQPYNDFSSLILPEPWHWSFKTIADDYEKLYDKDKIRKIITGIDFKGKEYILSNFDIIFK